MPKNSNFYGANKHQPNKSLSVRFWKNSGIVSTSDTIVINYIVFHIPE
jgi:hypothetical protein